MSTAKDGNISKMIKIAIEESINFEELMDSTDFNSWLEDDEIEKLKEKGQDIAPFNDYKKKVKNIKDIWIKIEKLGIKNFSDVTDNKSLDKYFVYTLFHSKIKRLNAKISSTFTDERKYYEKALHILLEGLNNLYKSGIEKKYWHILFYNDLSICYAGLKNFSISCGYAIEAKKIIESEENFKDFDSKLSDVKFAKIPNIEKHCFVSSMLYILYVIAVYNQAEAEKNSPFYYNAEQNFKKIIDYAKNNTGLINFNYCSALVNLVDLYIDRGRGEDALELLYKINKLELNQNDVRYWIAIFGWINALIDQSKYNAAEELLNDTFFSGKRGSFNLKKRHKITFSGFNVINFYARLQIEKVENNPKKDLGSIRKKEQDLKDAEALINRNIKSMKDRKQMESEKTAYKFLAYIHESLDNKIESIKYFTKFISEGKIDDLKQLIIDKNIDRWLTDCWELEVLERFSEVICKMLEEDKKYLQKNLLEIILQKLQKRITKECNEKNIYSRAQRITSKMEEIYWGEECEKRKLLENVINTRQKIFLDVNSSDKIGEFSGEIIRKRLDINEKKFDDVLYGRNEIKGDQLIEVIVLRRWNSFTPGLFRKDAGESLGGGYLLRINKYRLDNKYVDEDAVENIVIDPGYNFIQNFCSEDFFIEDIDTIILTHSHLDHCAELLPIMDLIYQTNKRYDKLPCNKHEWNQKKRVNLCLSRGAYNQFRSNIEDKDWQKQLKDVIILEDRENNQWKPFEELTITAIDMPHMDFGGVNSIGLRIEIKNKDIKSEKLCIGFTSDTPWHKEINEKFDDCDLLCIHLGGIKYEEIGYSNKRSEWDNRKIGTKMEMMKKLKKIYSESNHLLFFGTDDLLNFYNINNKNSLIIASEFGEELKYGIRLDLCKKLSKDKKDISILTGDIGLYARIWKDGTKKVRCNFCEEFVDLKDITTFPYGRQDAIHYICLSCNQALTPLQKHALVEHRITRH